MKLSRLSFAAIALVFMLVAIPITVWQIHQQQITNQHAATTACGKKSTPPSGSPGFSCTGGWGTKQSYTTYYTTTWFGCYGTSGKDPNDNCVPACGNIPECHGLSGPDCERKIKWFTADAGRFGCNAKVLVTNPRTGQAVVARVIDFGPACWVERSIQREIIDLSFGTFSYLGYDKDYNFRWAKVTLVDNTTPLGPVAACITVPAATATPIPPVDTFVTHVPLLTTSVPSLTLTPTPTAVPPTPTPTPILPTPTAKPTTLPLSPLVQVTTPTSIPLPTPTVLPTPTYSPTPTQTNTPTPVSLIVSRPSLPPTGPENIIGIGIAGVVIAVFGAFFSAF